MAYLVRRVKLLEQYIELLEKEHETLVMWAWVHGWRPNEEDVAEGEKLREKLEWTHDDKKSS